MLCLTLHCLMMACTLSGKEKMRALSYLSGDDETEAAGRQRQHWWWNERMCVCVCVCVCARARVFVPVCAQYTGNLCLCKEIQMI